MLHRIMQYTESILFWLSFVGVIVLLWMSSVRCEGHYRNGEFFTTHAKLTKVPTDIPSDAKFIKLDNNQITTIETNSFLNLGICTKLDLSNNHISKIEYDAFSTMVALVELDLGTNHLEKVKRQMFKGLQSLHILRINKNKLMDIEDGSFYGLNNLQELDISENNLKELRPDMFNKMWGTLKVLHLQMNHLMTLDLEVFRELIYNPPLWLAVSDPRVRTLLKDNPLVCDARFVLRFFSKFSRLQIACMVDFLCHCSQLSELSDTNLVRSIVQLQMAIPVSIEVCIYM